MKLRPARRQSDDHGVDGLAANPSLNAEPAAGHEGAENCGDIGAEHAERSARKNRERNAVLRSEEHTSELQSHSDLVCRLLLEKKKQPGPRSLGWCSGKA